jgi:ADP-L-glycero-D-manno-heptose 6-epimerase
MFKKNLENKITGFKFFNVFGPNEYHKGEMRSIVCKKFQELVEDGTMKLFKSYKSDYKNGGQKRDFVYIKDVVDVMFFFFNNPHKTGLYNLGTGKARSWNDLAGAMFKALGEKTKIKYVDMPEGLRNKYQYFTKADIDKLRQSGYTKEFSSLEESIKDYISYLKNGNYL